VTERNVTEVGFNHHVVETMQDPYAVFSSVRSRCPLGHSDELGGFYFPTTYEGVKRGFQDFRTFTSTEGSGLPPQVTQLLPVELDPPQHTRWRRVLDRFFTPEAAVADRPRIQAIADRLIDAFIARGSADAVNELTRPLLAQTMLPILGVPDEDREMLFGKLMWMVFHRMDDFNGWVARYGEVEAYLTGLVGKRRSEPRTKSDLIQCLVDEEFDGRRLTDSEGYRVILVALFGSLDSTSSAMSGALYHLGQNPQDKERLVNGEVPWNMALEEFLRYTSPIQLLRRTVKKPTELDGGRLEPGDVVALLCGAANHDPAKFADPDKCILDRDARDHLAFGTGGHVCIGRHFARLMLETCLKTMLRRVPDFIVPAAFVPHYTCSEARALTSLPINFTPGERVAA
jgi:cytochrome P450